MVAERTFDTRPSWNSTREVQRPAERSRRYGVEGPILTLSASTVVGFLFAFQPDNMVMGLIGAAIGLILGIMVWMIHCVINAPAR